MNLSPGEKEQDKTSKKMSDKKGWRFIKTGCLPMIGIFVAVFIIVGLIAHFSSSKGKTTNENKPIATIDEVVKHAAGGQFIEMDVSKINNKYNVDVHINGGDNMTLSLTRMGFWIKGAEICKEIFTSGFPVRKVRIFIYSPLTDLYGNTKNSLVAKMLLEDKTAVKINWENIRTTEFDKIVDFVWVHPALLRD